MRTLSKWYSHLWYRHQGFLLFMQRLWILPIDNFKNYAKNRDFFSCQPKKLWQMACNYDYECVSNACFANGTCWDYWLINEEQHQYYFCDLNMEFRAKPTCVLKVGNNVNCPYASATDPFVDLCYTNLGKCLNSVWTRYFTQPALQMSYHPGHLDFCYANQDS